VSTLLERAKATRRGGGNYPNADRSYVHPYAEVLDLALAYVRGEVTSAEIKHALGIKSSGHAHLGGILLSAARRGQISIKDERPPV